MASPTTTSRSSAAGPGAGRRLVLAVLATALPCAGWGSFDDLRHKVKPIDGALWAPLLGGGALVKGRARDRQVVFTFDDGPDHRATPLLLDHLERFGVKAIFFVNGHRMDRGRDDGPENVEVLREIHRRGHLIGNHTYSHRDLSAMRQEEVEWQIDAVTRLVEEVTGVRPWLFRPPFGKLGAAPRHLSRQRYTTVMWSIDPLDWQTDDPSEVLRRTVAGLEAQPEGGIVDLHDTNRASVEAFPLIMEWLGQRNAELAAMGQPVYRVAGPEAFYRARSRR